MRQHRRPIPPQLQRLFLPALVVVLVFSAAMLIWNHGQGVKEATAFKELAAIAKADAPPPTSSAISATKSPGAASNPPHTPAAQAILAQYRTLVERNPDMVGWIQIEGTGIDYPVMYTPGDGEFYLKHDFGRTKSASGVPFIDQRCVVNPFGTNTILYGHHMNNGSMFAGLLHYEDEAYYRDHRIIRFDTLYEQRQYEIVAVFRSQVYKENETVFKHYDFLNAQNAEDFNAYVTNIRALELYDTGVTATYGDELLTLVTCDYHTKNGQFVVLTKKTQ